MSCNIVRLKPQETALTTGETAGETTGELNVKYTLDTLIN